MFSIPSSRLMARAGVAATITSALLFGATALPVLAAAPSSSAAAQTSAKPADGRAHDHRADAHLMRAAYINAAAGALHMSVEDLRTAIRSGRSLSALAEERHITREQFRDAVVPAVRESLAADVKSGKLTQKEADRFLDRLQKGRLPLWTRDHAAKAAKAPKAPKALKTGAASAPAPAN